MAEPHQANPDAAVASPGEAATAGSGIPAPASLGLPSIQPDEKASAGSLPPAEASKLAAEAVVAPGAAQPKPVGKPAAAAVSARPARFVSRAASIGVAAALGSFVGSVCAFGFAHFWPGTPLPNAAAASGFGKASAAEQVIRTELAQFSALQASLDGAMRSATSQFAKIADRLDRAERATLDPAAKIAHIADAVDRLGRQNLAAAEITGAIADNRSSPTATDEKRPILHDWIVRDVRGHRALVESRYGGIYAIVAGATLPRLGRVEAIKRQDGQWVVMTERGVITSGQ